MSSKPKNVNKNEYLDRVRVAEQCWLIGNLDKVVNVRRDSDQDLPGRIKNRVIRHAWHTHHIALPYNSEYTEVLGKHFIGPDVATLFDLSTEEISALIPRISLYRVEMNADKTKVENVQEFYFHSHTDSKSVEKVLTGRLERFGGS